MRINSLRRRKFITLLGGAVASWPLAARAQQPAMPVIGFLNSASPDPFAHLVRAFHQGLNETGYIEDRNVGIEYRWAEGHYDRLPALAVDLVARQVAVIAATGSGPSALSAKAATTTIPVVFVASDSLRLGLVTSLSRPGGNVTGVSPLGYELEAKKLEILSELMPSASVVGILTNPRNPNAERALQDIQTAARTLGREILVVNASSERDIDSAFATLVQQHIGALLVSGDVFFSSRSNQIAALALRHAVPTISSYREFAAAGGLMSYGGSFTDTYRLAGIYTGRILNGEKPADLPVQQSTKVELILNLKAAKALGLTFPITLIGRADQVIE
jgi:putative ABC transport system substrate-binding protein